LTYIVGRLIQAWKEEQSGKAIQVLDATFAASLKELATSLDQKLASLQEGQLQATIIKKEIEMIKYLYNDLLKLRRQKIETAVQTGTPVNEHALLDFEADYHKSFGSMAYKYDASKLLFTETRVDREISSNYMAIRLIQDAADFVAIDLRTYGPFKKEDIAFLPKEHAEIMITEGKAKRIGAFT
jgi:DNA replication initiation complex subunit (GINS family)